MQPPPVPPTSEKRPSGSNFLPTSQGKHTVFSAEVFIGLILWGLGLIRSAGKGKKRLSLHYTAAQLLEKGVLVEIEDLPTSQYVSSEGRRPPSRYLGVELWAGLQVGGEKKHGPCLEGAVRMVARSDISAQKEQGRGRSLARL